VDISEQSDELTGLQQQTLVILPEFSASRSGLDFERVPDYGRDISL
jgi:hypothetical protein